MSDDLVFSDELPTPVLRKEQAPWQVLVVDDEPAVHEVTKLVMAGFEMEGRPLQFTHCYSAAEARTVLCAPNDFALILLDVVMETEHAGLDLARYIREDIGNRNVRIVLRTGQPGQAPERRVIVQYDINDYKAKTELTGDKLFTSLTAAIRSHQQLMRLVEMRCGLERIVEGASELFDLKSVRTLAAGVLAQVAGLVQSPCDGVLVLRDGRGEGFAVLAASGAHAKGAAAGVALDPHLRQRVRTAFERRQHSFEGAEPVLYLKTSGGREIVVALSTGRALTDTEQTLVAVFSGRLATAFDNVFLYEQLQAANETLEQRVAERTRQLTAANDRLTQQWQRLKRTNDHKADVLGTVAHDLKNPLGVILGRSEMMNELLSLTPPNIERARGQIEQIRSSVARMTSMVDELINDAMLDAEDIVLRPADIDTAGIVATVIDANAPLAERKGQMLVYSGPDALPGRADPDRLREAIDNLVSNAVKYSPPGGRILVSLDSSEAGHQISVTDSGPGLTPEDEQRLFGRFQRLSARPTGGESSTGLGLFICRRIVELHGGRITATGNGAGKGATFAITLPPTLQRGAS